MDKEVLLNDDDEVVCQLKIRGRSGDRTMNVSEAYGETIPEKALITYYDGTIYSKTGDIVIDYIGDLTGNSDCWNIENDSKGIYQGYVSRIDEDRVFIRDGSEYGEPLYLYSCTILEYDTRRGTVTPIDYTDVDVGSKVIYYLRSECRGIIVIK